MRNKELGIRSVLVICILLCALFGLSSCADASGLHDQNALLCTFKFTNMGDDVSGTFSLAGDFDGDDVWEISVDQCNVTLTNGEGTSDSTIAVTSSWIKFTLCDSAWLRTAWYPSVRGNSDSGDQGASNFYIEALDLSAGTATIVIDGSLCGTGDYGSDDMIYVE
ncbi:MAG: hypothetical protein IJ630_03440 [Treponema sp.]|nr:hypothetical protein [Treponema sp.]